MFNANLIRNGLCLFACLLVLPLQAAVDPTRPSSATATVSGATTKNKKRSLRLQSIRVSDNSSRAVIDGKTVYLGSRIGGAKVISINLSSVVLQQGSERIQLGLGSTAKFKKNSQEVN
ncbi:MAG: hypothetical protein V7707_03425 [Motiliproteus sp.]